MRYSWELSKFDTEILGYKVAKIINIDSSGDSEEIFRNIHNLNEDLRKNDTRYATYRVNANNYPLIQSLEKSGYLLVDGLITLEATINLEKANNHSNIRIAAENDLPQLLELAGIVFNNVTRYYHDPIIPKEKADLIYKKWIKNTLEGKFGDMVLVWEKKGILGLITLDKKGQILLIGLAKEARGKGIGRELVQSALNQFGDWGIKKILVETQMTNIPALRLYQSCGFKITDSYLTFRLLIS